MTTYNVEIKEMNNTAVTLEVGFGEPATNDTIVKDAKAAIEAISSKVEGKVVLITGRASLPVAGVLMHEVDHIAKAVGFYDPKLTKYVVAVSHDPAYNVGDLI